MSAHYRRIADFVTEGTVRCCPMMFDRFGRCLPTHCMCPADRR